VGHSDLLITLPLAVLVPVRYLLRSWSNVPELHGARQGSRHVWLIGRYYALQ